jgi:gliding motility-associated-like protein
MRFLKLKQLLALVIIMFSIGVQKASASHYAAVDLYVTYIGAGQNGCTGTTDYKYEITLQIYAACDVNQISSLPIGFDQIRIWSTNANKDTSIYFGDPFFAANPGYLTMVADTVDQLCGSFKPQNSCRQAGVVDKYPGYARNTYKLIYSLPSAQTDWKFSWNSGARNGGIKNLLNPSSLSIYVEAGLNNLDKYYNSTPRFTEVPLPYICINQPAIYLNGPVDPDNDSLITFVQTPLNGAANSLCPYAPGYTYLAPIDVSASNPFKLDPRTGTATFTPTQVAPYVLAFRCEEYDPKTLKQMAYIFRDVDVTVLPCTTPPPPIDPTPLNTLNTSFVKGALYICPGSNASFDVGSQSSNPAANIFMYANIAATPGALFTPTGQGTNSVKGTFSWTPTINDLGDHTIIIESEDSTCSGTGFSLVLKNYQVVLIRVVPGIDAGPDLPVCKINKTARQLFVLGTAGLDVKWTDYDTTKRAQFLNRDDIANPVSDPDYTVNYIVTVPDLKGNCKNRDTVSVYIDTSNAIDVFPNDPLVMCRPDYLQLDAIVTGTGPLQNLACGTCNNPNVNCATPNTIAIYGTPLYGRLAYDSVKGAPTLYNYVKTSKQQFLITKSELKEDGMLPGTFKSMSFETAHNGDPQFSYNNFTIAMKCTTKDKLSASSFEGNMTTVYTAPNRIQFPDGKHTFVFDVPYCWDTTMNIVVEMCYSFDDSCYKATCVSPTTAQSPIIKYSPTTNPSYLSYFPITFNPFIPDYVPDTATKNVCGSLTAPFNNIVVKNQRPAVQFDYCDAPSVPFTIKWEPGFLLSDSTIFQPLAYVPKSISYSMQTIGRSGCILKDSVDIYMPVHNFKVGPIDSSICLGETAPLFILNGTHFIWHEYEDGKYLPATSLSCTDCEYTIASPKKTTVYKVEVADSVWCFDTLTINLTVKPLPQVHILNNDTIIKYGKSLQLLVNGARMYNWTPVSSLNNPNISYPIATPTEPTMYVAAGIGSNGCRSYDTVRVGIDYRDKLFIPSAFSPNGDGKNDVFKVANLTFQRIMEFRVFNRWGQEIFNTTSSETGWDGTWKNVEQDMGNYQYIIRVGYPDGLVETYKGDVTLVR